MDGGGGSVGALVMLDDRRRQHEGGRRRHRMPRRHGRRLDDRDIRWRLRRRGPVVQDVGGADGNRSTDGGDHGHLDRDRAGGEASGGSAGRDDRRAGQTAAVPPRRGGRGGAARRARAAGTELGHPSFSRIVFFSSRIGRAGRFAASARLLARSCVPKAAAAIALLDVAANRRRQRRDPPRPPRRSSRRTSSQVSLRASAASARPIRARTSSDLTLGTVVSITSAICS